MTTLDPIKALLDKLTIQSAKELGDGYILYAKGMGYVIDAVRAALSSLPAQAVGVKALEWDDYAHPYMMSYAIVPALWIAYRIALRSDGTKTLRLERLENHNDDLGVFPDTEAAKAAAQADYEARILSALVAPSQPAAVGVTSAMPRASRSPAIRRPLTLDDHIGRWWAINPLVKLVPGDRLWVREAWRPLGDGPLSECTGPADITFMATDDEALVAQCNYRPSIHMPKWASRLTLTITGRKVERLQSISEADCKAEGIGEPYLGDGDPPFVEQSIMVSRWMQYRNLWGRLNGPDSWATNPWVIVLSFTAERRNIEEIAT